MTYASNLRNALKCFWFWPINECLRRSYKLFSGKSKVLFFLSFLSPLEKHTDWKQLWLILDAVQLEVSSERWISQQEGPREIHIWRRERERERKRIPDACQFHHLSFTHTHRHASPCAKGRNIPFCWCEGGDSEIWAFTHSLLYVSQYIWW